MGFNLKGELSLKKYTEIILDKPRKMQISPQQALLMGQNVNPNYSQLEMFLYQLWFSLKEDDPKLTMIQLIEIIKDIDPEYIKDKLIETLDRDVYSEPKEFSPEELVKWTPGQWKNYFNK